MIFVYRIFDADGDLLYVGQSANVEQRLSGHGPWLRSHPGYRVHIEGPFSAAAANVMERRAIICEKPARNKKWSMAGSPSLAYCTTLSAQIAQRYLTGRAEYNPIESALHLSTKFGIRPVETVEGWRQYHLLEIEHHYLAQRGELPIELEAAS